jgi:predicted enzyme related to lactoylglutathione lyase
MSFRRRRPAPSMGWISVCTDPAGNDFGLWQNDPAAPGA